MKSRALFAIVLLAASPQAAPAADEHLNDQQKLGWRLFETSCGVCHTRPTLVAGLYGPELNKDTAGGNEEAPSFTETVANQRLAIEVARDVDDFESGLRGGLFERRQFGRRDLYAR